MDADEGTPAVMPTAVADEGIAERLEGTIVPSLTLSSTAGPVRFEELTRDLAIVFVYPHATGLPDAPVPGWDLIPGARGCTAQACGFRDHKAQLEGLGARLAGVSVQTVDEQLAFAERVGIDFPLISDPTRELGMRLGLPTFTAGGRTFYRRLTLVAEGGHIEKVFGPVRDPERNAMDVAAWLHARRIGE